MAFKKGHDPNRAKGRPKGSLGKATMAEQACLKMGINPFELLAAIAAKGDLTAIIQMCKHIEPPKKPIEVAVDPENNAIKFIFEDYTKK